MTALIKPAVPVQSTRVLWLRKYRGSLLFVALPTLIAAVYYFFIAADLYASEASYVVRSQSRMQVGGLASLLQSSAAGGHEDAYSVQAFATSRDLLAILARKIDLKAVFNRPEADFMARYPNLVDWDSDEDFYRYFQRRVEVTYDTTTDLSTLTVKTFRAEDSQRIADIVLSESEALINRLNQRGHDNAVREAEADVKRAEDGIVAAQKGMLEYRNRESLLDPRKTSGAIFENQARTEAELASTRTRLNELLHSAPQSPMIGDLQTHIRALEQQIAGERSSLTGGNAALAPKLSEYEQLSLHEDFATKELASALASLEAARAESRRQQVYLERVIDASKPDRALYPKRLVSVLIVFVSAFLIYSIGLLLLAGVREHAQQ